jgi:hypothetical protein
MAEPSSTAADRDLIMAVGKTIFESVGNSALRSMMRASATRYGGRQPGIVPAGTSQSPGDGTPYCS